MSAVIQRYRDISPVTLQLEAGLVSSSLYCGEVEGLSAGLVESFLVVLYRCQLCQFTCSPKDSIGSHLLLKHRPLTLTYLGEAGGVGGTEDREEPVLQRGASPYQLDLNGQPKQSDEDEDFLLYNMLDNMSPPTCDIGSEAGLQVAHNCEVSTLFVEENSIFPLKGGPVDLSCPMDPTATQEEMAQSAHLKTLGLCRISATKPPPAPLPPTDSRSVPTLPEHRPPLSDTLKPRETDSNQTRTPPRKRGLPCLLCPLTLPSRRLLNVHTRSHRAAGGFSCVCCSWTADSWEQLQPHWRGHCRKRRREGPTQDKEKTALRSFSSAASQNVPQKSKHVCHHQRSQSDRWRSHPIGRRGDTKQEDRTDRVVPSQTSGSRSCSLERMKKSRRKKEEDKEDKDTVFSCSLCHRRFSSKLTLRRHLGVHGGEKPFTCPHCPYSSRLKASLLQHLRTHTGEKPYRCTDCPYASIDRSSLLRHSRTHSQEKPYKCQHCDYSSIQKKCLDLHARRHHTGESFPCQQCKYSSPDRHLLLRHVRRHHALPSTPHCDLAGDQAL